MGLIQANRPSSGGGGGLTLTGFQVDTLEQETDFTAGSVTINLTQTPLAAAAITVDYNGQRLLKDTGWSYAAGVVTILFADPYVTTYDANPVFQVVYPY